jgi:hypothetical protein
MSLGRAKLFALCAIGLTVAVDAQTIRLDRFIGIDLRNAPPRTAETGKHHWHSSTDRYSRTKALECLEDQSGRPNAVYRPFGPAGDGHSGRFDGVRSTVRRFCEEDRQLVLSGGSSDDSHERLDRVFEGRRERSDRD